MQINTEEISRLVGGTEKSLRDSAYILVGLGVLSFQQTQVRRRELAKRLAPTKAQIDAQIGAFEERLPASARNVFSTVRSAARTPENALRNVVGLD